MGTLPNSLMSSFVDEFDKDAKTYTMNYTEVPLEDFNNKLLTALADGYAPDLVIAPVSIAFANLNRIYYTSHQRYQNPLSEIFMLIYHLI